MIKILLAIFICFTDCDLKDMPLTELAPLIKNIAIEQEWMDSKEPGWNFVQEEDVKLLRWRRDEYHRMPKKSDVFFLPPQELLQEWMDFNREHAAWLREMAELDMQRRMILLSFADNCDWRHTIFTNARNAQWWSNSTLRVREYLNVVRSMMGADNFYSKNYPTCVDLASVPTR